MTVQGLTSFARPRVARLRVKGIYRALAHTPQTDYWTNLFQEIYPQGLNCERAAAVRPRFAREFNSLVSGSRRGVDAKRRVTDQPARADASGRPRARQATSRPCLASSPRRRSERARLLERACAVRCTVTSSLSAAVILADENASAVDAGGDAALGSRRGHRSHRSPRPQACSACDDGALRRRCTLPVANTSPYSPRAARSRRPPDAARRRGGVRARLVADNHLRAERRRSRRGRSGPGSTHSLVAVTAGLGLLVAAAAVSFLGLYDTGSRSLGRLRSCLGSSRWRPAPSICCCGSALAAGFRRRAPARTRRRSRCSSTRCCSSPLPPASPPGSFACCCGGSTRRACGARPVVYLALRRLAAARGLLVVLGGRRFGVARQPLLRRDTRRFALRRRRGRRLTWRPAATRARSSKTPSCLPRSFPYPVTLVGFANQAAALARRYSSRRDARRPGRSGPDAALAERLGAEPGAVPRRARACPRPAAAGDRHLRSRRSARARARRRQRPAPDSSRSSTPSRSWRRDPARGHVLPCA